MKSEGKLALMAMDERRKGQRRGVERPGNERRNTSQAMTITEDDMAFAQSCPCDRCEASRRRLRICREHGIPDCMECGGLLERTDAEALWVARYHLRDAYEEFLESRSLVKKFAATCQCPLCARWRARFMGGITRGRRDRNRLLRIGREETRA